MIATENPGQVAWAMAWCAADEIIDRASLRNPDVRRLATHALAKSFLPACSIIVANGGDRFDLVDDENAALDPIFAAWADDVVAATVAALHS